MNKTILPGGCYIGKISVFPKDWNKKNADISVPWRIQYRFYDPVTKQSRLKIVKGMNDHTSLMERQKETRLILKSELELLKEGLNPITGKFVVKVSTFDINEETPFLDALEYARGKIDVVHCTKLNMKSNLKFLKQAAIKCDIDHLSISEVKRKHFKMLFKKLAEIRPAFSNSNYNKYRTNLNILFKWIIDQEFEVIEYNPLNDIRKKEEMVTLKRTLTREERILIDRHLKTKKLTAFRLYIRLFFHTGIRNTELLKIKGKDVDLANQRVKCIILKGRKKKETLKTIKNIAVRYWALALKNCGPEDYIFSKDLKPGNVEISNSQITRRWNRHVKQPVDNGGLNIDVDFYAFKHLNTTEIVDSLGYESAANLNSHSSTAMVRKIYDVHRYDRAHEKLKTADNYF